MSLDLAGIRTRENRRARFGGPNDATAMLAAIERVLVLCERAEAEDAEVVRQTILRPCPLILVEDVRRALRGGTP